MKNVEKRLHILDSFDSIKYRVYKILYPTPNRESQSKKSLFAFQWVVFFRIKFAENLVQVYDSQKQIEDWNKYWFR